MEQQDFKHVWLILVRVSAASEANSIGLTTGSTANVQCFVPTEVLDEALKVCGELLAREGFRFEEVLKHVAFAAGEDYPDAPKFVLDDVKRARESGESFTGTFFVSKHDSSLQVPPPED